MKTKLQIFITTYNRPGMLLDLLKDIKKNTTQFDVDILIINDKSISDYKQVVTYLKRYFADNHSMLEVEEHQGKANYWKIINYGYQSLKGKKYNYLIQFPDDYRLIDDFFAKAIKLYNGISDSKKACMNIAAEGRSFVPQWNNILPKKISDDIIYTGWVDMTYITRKQYLKALNYCIDPIDISWSGNKRKSSGVGMQISQRLHKNGLSMYQVVKSLVIHEDHESVMHPEERKKVPLITNHDQKHNDKITASAASMPSRVKSLADTVNSILPQVDELRVYLNNYKEVPKYLNHLKIKVFRSDSCDGDLGDAGKFYGVENIEGYHFTIDDDLVYPPDYVQKGKDAIERNKRKCCVTHHGRRFKKLPIDSYYRSGHSSDRFACLRNVVCDEYIMVGGTGVMAYHTDTIRFKLKDFKLSNMADIWFGIKCQALKIPILCLSHKKGWIKESQNYDSDQSIFAHCHTNDKVQTDEVNKIEWTLHKIQ